MSLHIDFKKEYKDNQKDSMLKWVGMILLALVMTAGVVYLVLFLITGEPIDFFKNKDKTDNSLIVGNDSDTVGPGYAVETKYIGGIGYSQVYEVPFQQTSFYTTNKVLWERIPDVMPTIADTATNFMDTLLNSGYRSIAEDKEGYINSLMPYLSERYPYNEIESEAYSETPEEFIGNYADYLIENEITMEAKFLTDTSLIYEDAFIYVRGIVEYTVFSSKDDAFPVTGQKQAMMTEVVLMRDGLDPSVYKVVDWYQLDMPEETDGDSK